MPIELLPLVLTKGRACSTLCAVADGFQDFYSIRLTESLCPPSPSGRAEAVPTDQAEMTARSCEMTSFSCRSTATLIILPPLVLTMGRACAALLAVAVGLPDLSLTR